MLLLLGLLGGANSTLLVSSINTLPSYLQVNSCLLFTSNDTIAFMYESSNFLKKLILVITLAKQVVFLHCTNSLNETIFGLHVEL